MSIKDLIEKGTKARQQKVRKRALKHAAIGAAIGVSVGAAAGVLLAPKSGRETRENIAKAARELPEKAQELAEKAKGKVEEIKEKIQEKGTSSVAAEEAKE